MRGDKKRTRWAVCGDNNAFLLRVFDQLFLDKIRVYSNKVQSPNVGHITNMSHSLYLVHGRNNIGSFQQLLDSNLIQAAFLNLLHVETHVLIEKLLTPVDL